MRLIHDVNFSAQEVEFYRQLVFANITQGMKQLLDALDDMDIKLSETSLDLARLVDDAPDIKDSQPFPSDYYNPLKLLWEDENVQRGWARGNEAALPDKFVSDHHLVLSDVFLTKHAA
jgi:guanine nucleotide-binding protein subunit alpha